MSVERACSRPSSSGTPASPVERGEAWARPSVVIVALCLVACVAPEMLYAAQGSPLDDDLRLLEKRLRPSVVGVRVYFSKAPDPSGAGNATSLAAEETLLEASGMLHGDKGRVMTLVPGGIPRDKERERARVEVTLHGGTRHPGRWLECDLDTGITLLEIVEPPGKLEPARPARRALKEGALVVAIGNAKSSMSVGRVRDLCAPARAVGSSFPRTILAGVALQRGDLGGMLVDSEGGVVGMLAFAPADAFGATASAQAGGDTAAFAIPMDLLERICSQLASQGRVVRGAIGAQCVVLSKAEMQARGLSGVGALVQAVYPVSRGRNGGLLPNDIIVDVDNRRLHEPADLAWFRERVEYGEIGSEIRLEVYRSTETFHGSKVLQIQIVERGGIEGGPTTREPDSEGGTEGDAGEDPSQSGERTDSPPAGER